MTRKKPLRAFRKKRRAGNKAMTKDESARVMAAKEGPCIPCLVWAEAGNMPLSDVMRDNDYNHVKSGNLRVGHGDGFAGCLWHHRGRMSDGWNHAHMRAHFGPSLMDGSRLFHATYGSDDELIARQTQILQETP
jgi:hypothetical protein